MNDGQQLPEWFKKIQEEEEIFWSQQYPSFTKEEKIRYWSGSLHRQMRWQAESGLDPYDIYSLETLADIKKVENDFVEFLEIIFAAWWKGEWNELEIKKRLGLTA